MSKQHNEPTETPGNEAKQETQPSIIEPIIDDLKGRNKPQVPQTELGAPPRGPLHPPPPAELDQDPGGGYNPDGTYPQS